MRCQNVAEIGKMLREAREGLGLSQRRLAVRAGTSQDAVSRIERGVETPTLERLAQLMLAMGLRPVIEVEALEGEIPRMDLAVATEMTPGERLREASSWNRAAALLAAGGGRARLEGHPATSAASDD